jgi:hypothetical protein
MLAGDSAEDTGAGGEAEVAAAVDGADAGAFGDGATGSGGATVTLPTLNPASCSVRLAVPNG